MAKYNVSKKEAKELGIERVKISSSKVKNLDDAKDFINSSQAEDAISKSDANAPAIRNSINNYNKIVEEMTGIDGTKLKAPDAPGFEDAYGDLRGQYGISELETKLNDLNTQSEEIAAQFRQQKADENGKFVMTNVAEGRVSQHERAANERLDSVNRQINTINNQLNTAYKVIDTVMKYKGMDYDAAVKSYDTQFSNYMSTFNLVKGIDDSIKTEQRHQEDVARANLQIMYNNIAANSDGWKSLSKSQQTQISKLEAQSGLPQGFYKTIEAKNPGGEIITTKSWQDGSGKEYVSVVTRQNDGSLKTNNMYVGQGKVASGGGDNADSRASEAIDKTTTFFESLAGGDGHVSPQVWSDARRIWTGSLADFDSRFRNFVNPADPKDYAGFEEYRADFKK